MVFRNIAAIVLCTAGHIASAHEGIRMEIAKELNLHKATGASDLKQHLMTLAQRAEPQVDERFHNMAASLGTNITQAETSLVKGNGITVPLVNVLNSQYMGRIYIGTPKSQDALVVVDSGSNWLAVMAYGPEKAYMPSKSTTMSYIGAQEPQTYGSATLSGSVFSDTVCLQNLTAISSKKEPSESDLTNADCIGKFQFIAVMEQRGLNAGIQGILGLGPLNNKSPSLFSELL